jgi:hypothetical protein
MLHQAADVVDVAREPIELGTDDRRFDFARAFDRCVQLRPIVVGAAVGLGESLEQLESPRRESLLLDRQFAPWADDFVGSW